MFPRDCGNYKLSFSCFFKVKNDLWLDGTDEMKEGIWKWSSSQKRFGFANWHPTEPNGKKRENCIVGDTSMKPKLQWADVDCNSKRSLICQKKYNIVSYDI